MLYTIKLISFHGDEIVLIDLCMQMCRMDMGEAATCIDHMPSIIARNVDESKVEEFKKQFETIGASLQIISADEEAQMDPADEINVAEHYETVDNNTIEYEVVNNFDSNVYSESIEEDNSSNNETMYYEQSQAEYSNQATDNKSISETKYLNEDNTSVGNGNQYDNQSVVQINPSANINNINFETAAEEEEPDINLIGGCPKCGSAFVTAKKVSSLFGGTKVRYICEACKHRF